MPEGRMGIKDTKLQDAYKSVRENGNFYFPPEQIRYRIPSETLKFRYKKENISGLQLADLLAHPSHMYIRSSRNHPVTLGKFARSVSDILVASKYDRSYQGDISGYGTKYLP